MWTGKKALSGRMRRKSVHYIPESRIISAICTQHLVKRHCVETCRRYPRHIEEFEGVREMTLSVSCPEVAKILLQRKEPVQFLIHEDEKEECLG